MFELCIVTPKDLKAANTASLAALIVAEGSVSDNCLLNLVGF